MKGKLSLKNGARESKDLTDVSVATLEPVPVNDVAAQEVNKLHQEIAGASLDALNKAINIGKLLTDQKKTLQHGQWMPWCEQNLKFSLMSVSRYMRLYDAASSGLLKGKKIEGLAEAYRLVNKMTSGAGDEKDVTPSTPASVSEKLFKLWGKAEKRDKLAFLRALQKGDITDLDITTTDGVATVKAKFSISNAKEEN